MEYIRYIASPVGVIKISSDGEYITNIDFSAQKPDVTSDDLPLLIQAEKELAEYFEGKRIDFTLPIKAKGTAFQKQVWNAISQIPYGKTISYKNIAESLGKPKACRAVGNACGANPVPVIIPCHRVLAVSGEGGYTGGMAIKRYLLELEKKNG